MRDLTDDILESWLRPATVSLDAEAIGRYRSAVANIKAKVTTETAFHLVGVAYRLPTEDARSWFLERVREADPEFVDAAQDDLIARLGCCAVFAALGVRGDTASLLCLLAQSASFLGAAPAEPELHALVESAQHEQALAARARPNWKPVAAAVATMLAEDPQPAEEGQDAEDVYDVQARAVNHLAGALDMLAAQVEARAVLVDEEYNALWWSYTHRSMTEGVPWEEISPLEKRVVLASAELGSLVTLVPSPPMLRGLLALVLGGQGGEQVTLGDVMVAAASSGIGLVSGQQNRLLPFSTAVSKIAEFGADQSTWRDVMLNGASLKIEVDRKVSALDAASQLLRETEIGALL